MDFSDILNLLTVVVAVLTAFLVLGRNANAGVYRLITFYLLSIAAWAFIDFESGFFPTRETFMFWRRFDIFWFFTGALMFHVVIEYTRIRVFYAKRWLLPLVYTLALAGAVIHLLFIVPTDAMRMPDGDYQAVANPGTMLLLKTLKMAVVILSLLSFIILLLHYIHSRPPKRTKAGLMVIAFSFPVLAALIIEVWFSVIRNMHVPLQLTNTLLISSIFIAVITYRYKVLDTETQVAMPLILNTLSDGIILTDGEGAVLYCNKAAENLAGISISELQKNAINSLFEGTGEYGPLEEKIALQVDITDYECRVLSRPDHPIVSISLSFVRNRQWITGMVFLIRDISERIRIEKELMKFRTAINQSPATILITDTDGQVEYVNPGFERITGYTMAEAKGQNPRILKSGLMPEQVYRDLWATIKAGNTWIGEFINKKKNGEFYWESAIITPVKDESGKILNFIALKEDITQRKKAEETLLRSEHELRILNAQKDRFLSIIAHDLRAPFNILVNASEIVYKKFHALDEADIMTLLESIHDSATNTHGLLENLLLWSRSQLGKIEVNATLFDVSSVVDEVCETLAGVAANKEITLFAEVKKSTLIYADRNMILMILRNLVSNALKFTPRKGTVSIGLIPDGAPHSKTGMNVLSVHDTGVGMTPEVLSQLFMIDRNVSMPGTENEPGTGLGLMLCKEFIEKIGGEIWVESKAGTGTSFYISLQKGLKQGMNRPLLVEK